MTARSRSALTLVELVVVLAILAFLVGLFLPAVVRWRQLAGRTQSQNNIKQIAIACHSYHADYGNFPAGNDAERFSAAAKLLPYLEQSNLHKKIDFKKPLTDQANAEARKVQLPVFLSPQDPQKEVTRDAGATNYLFNAGSKPGLADNDGIFFQDSAVRISQVTDGTSNTLMIGETLKGDGGAKAVDVGRQYVALKDKRALKDLKEDSGVAEFKDNKHIAGDRCASWMDGRFLQGTFTGTRKINDPRPDVSCEGGNGGLSALRSLTGGVSVGMCDGSVRFVSEKVDAKILKLLTSRDDGEAIPDF